MSRPSKWFLSGFVAALVCSCAVGAQETAKPDEVKVDWAKVIQASQSTPTLQVVVNPQLLRGAKLHDGSFAALHMLGADYVRYVPWLPYPRQAVAELSAPANGKTSWDFTHIDPTFEDFMKATDGHSVIINFSTIPAWMYKTEKPVTFPDDPNQVFWHYTQGTELRDPSMKEVSDYFARLLSWYTKGGFTDELGKKHESGYHYPVAFWEVLNEIDFEHNFSPEMYTKYYDAVVTEMHKVSPETKFVGLSMAMPSLNPNHFEYFLNHANHAPGVPLDYISYHFYAVPTVDQSPEVQQFTFFAQADGFLNTVRYIETIRKRLSPETKTMVNEIGAISADDLTQGEPGHVTQPIPNSYWSLTGAMYAYIFGEFTKMGIDVAGESQLVGYPTQFPSVSEVDWKDGSPNPRLRVLQLLHENFGPGDKVVDMDTTVSVSPFIYSLPVVTKDGKKRILLVNKRDRPFQVTISGISGGQLVYVDQISGFGPPATAKVSSDTLTLTGYSVAAITLP